jgi:hypothetical protein
MNHSSPIARFLAGMSSTDLTPWQKQQQLVGGTTMDSDTYDPEINAIDDAYKALSELEHEAQTRALSYLIARLAIGIGELQR